MREYHLQFFGPLRNQYVEWPEGSVSVYRISGDQIADRVRFEQDEQGFNILSKPIRRDSWCGYIGCFSSLADAVKAIEADRAEQKMYAEKEAARKKA